MKNTILIAQLIVTLLLSAVILLQVKGTGFGLSFGDSSEKYRTRRGLEKLLHKATIILATVFFFTSILNIVVK